MARTHHIEIRPFGERSWSLSFGERRRRSFHAVRSGATAEAAAKLLAMRLADVGEDAEIVIGLRDGSVAGRFIAKG